MRIWLYAARSGSLGLPFVCPACDCCPWAALELTEGTGPSRSHSDRQGQRACALGAAARLQGVSCVPPSPGCVAHYLSDGRCDTLGSCGHCWEHRQLKRAFVSWSFASPGQEPGSKRGKKQIALPAPE